MPIVTVPGAMNTTISVPYETAATASLATSLLQSVYAASNAGTLLITNSSSPSHPTPGAGMTGEFVVQSSAVTVPAGYTVTVSDLTPSVTVTEGNTANELLILGQGGGSFNLGTGSGSVAGGGGTNLFTVPTVGGGAFLIVSDGNNTVEQGSGSVTLGGGIIDMLGAGSPTVWASAGGDSIIGATGKGVFVNNGGADTYTGSTGSDTVYANAAGGLYQAGSGQLVFASFANSTIVGGSGSATLFSAFSNDLVTGGSGQLALVDSGGIDTINSGPNGNGLYIGNVSGSEINLAGFGSNINYLVAAIGNETLSAVASTGLSVLVAGTGNTLAIGGIGESGLFAGTGAATLVAGVGADLFAFVNGDAGGSDIIEGFKSTDVVSLIGYGAAADRVALAAQTNTAATGATPASTTLVLPDNTRITLMGVGSLNPSQVFEG